MVQNYPSVVREIKAYECLARAPTTSPLATKIQQNIRQPLDHFQLRHSNFDYHFLVHEPLGVSMNELLKVGIKLPIYAVWAFACDFLHTLDFIHGANVVHAGTAPPKLPFPFPFPLIQILLQTFSHRPSSIGFKTRLFYKNWKKTKSRIQAPGRSQSNQPSSWRRTLIFMGLFVAG